MATSFVRNFTNSLRETVWLRRMSRFVRYLRSDHLIWFSALSLSVVHSALLDY